MARKVNPCGKTRDIENPYEVWKGIIPGLGMKVEYRVLKKYQAPEKEKENKYSRWFVAAKSEGTFGSWEYGDTYVSDIKPYCQKVG